MNRDFPSGTWSVPIELAHEPDFQLGRIRVRPSACEIQLEARTERVEPRVMQALVAFAQRKGGVVTKDELVQRCWNGRIVGEDAINRCIAKVRKLAELDRGQSFRLETIPKIGLRMVETAAPISPPDASDVAQAPVAAAASARASHGRQWQLPLAAAVLLTAAAVVAAFAIPLFRDDGADTRNALAPVVRNADWLLPGASFRDCPVGCPEMVVIPLGDFLMGSTPNEAAEFAADNPASSDDESPQHEVLIQHRFALGKYDVTRGEYGRFVAETNRTGDGNCYALTVAGVYVATSSGSWRHPGFGQTDRDPAVCISWNDAVAYATWLGRKTKQHYRLPTEAEWEYASRAGSNGPRPRDVSTRPACNAFNGAELDYHELYPGDRRYDSGCRDGYGHTSPAGSFPANLFGLFDMLGNAGQWTADCYHPTYGRAPVDGSAWIDPGCEFRVVRGGAWQTDSNDIRFARRGRGVPQYRFDANGFRVARDMWSSDEVGNRRRRDFSAIR